MERHGYIKTIQGGGNSIGFPTPRQVVRLEPTNVVEISREILSQSCALSNNKGEQIEVWKKN